MLTYMKGLNSWSTCMGGQYELHIWDFLWEEIYLSGKSYIIEQKSNFGKQNYPARIGTYLATKHEATFHDTVDGRNPASVDMVNIPSCMLGGAGFLPSTVAGAALNLNCSKVSAPLNSSAFNKQVLRTQPAPHKPCQNRHCFYIRRIKQVSRCETTQAYKLVWT